MCVGVDWVELSLISTPTYSNIWIKVDTMPRGYAR